MFTNPIYLIYMYKQDLVLKPNQNNSIEHRSFVYTQSNNQIVLFVTIQFSISHLFAQFKCHSSIWTIDRTLPSATTPDQSGPGTDGSEGVLHIPQSLQTGVLLFDCLP